ncbi:ferredoxin [Clostridium tepidiprofundi DSM 19306]|uniref:Ferredoxin n=1 Tax=Clostridium tepidiprofundi DSM 19306 TaxID=1121338 RepID=A0A151B5S6_9CLOT|nr:4Fe-4S binding protein [Clostridium tepidiprofundi]KYH35278.1 ferredoxin [Clostridium tepidiprofundi DSM 19306]
MSEETFMGVPRDTIDWSPRIDYDKCNYCMECVKFCPHNVYGIVENEDKKLIIKNPNNCVVFCRACGKACGLDAITFPNKAEVTKKIKQTRKDMK